MRIGVLGIAILFAGPLVSGSTQAGPGEEALDQYFSTLVELSQTDCAVRRWDYFGTNELSFYENYPAVEGRGGAIIGVGFQQNLSLAIRSDAVRYIILDIEPTVGALVPFFGILMTRHPTRREFLSRLMGVDLTEKEFRQLVEPDRIEMQEGRALEAYLKARIAEVTGRVPADAIQRNIASLHQLMLDEVLPNTPIPRSRFPRVLANLDSLLDAERSLRDYPARVLPADKERGLLEFLYNHASVTYFAPTAEARTERATWFATEQNYTRTRVMWLEGRFSGVIADITGSKVGGVGRWLEGQDLRVSAIYVSNVPEYLSRHERRALFDNLRKLPLEPDALVLTTRRSGFDLYPRIRSLDAAAPRFGLFTLTLLTAFGVMLVVLAVLGRGRLLRSGDRGTAGGRRTAK